MEAVGCELLPFFWRFGAANKARKGPSRLELECGGFAALWRWLQHVGHLKQLWDFCRRDSDTFFSPTTAISTRDDNGNDVAQTPTETRSCCT